MNSNMSKKGNCLGDRDHCCGLGNSCHRRQIRACSQSTLAKGEGTVSGRLPLWEGLKKELAHAIGAIQAFLLATLCLITAALGKIINLLLQSLIYLTYLDDQRKPGANTLTFSRSILILVLIGWPELLSVLWWYNPRDKFPKITTFKFTFDLVGFVAAHSSSKYSDRYVSLISPNVYSFLWAMYLDYFYS